MYADAQIRRLQRRFTVLLVLMLVEMVIIGVLWLTGVAADEPVGLPVRSKLGSKDNPIDCLFVRQLAVISKDSEHRILLSVDPKGASLTMGRSPDDSWIALNTVPKMSTVTCYGGDNQLELAASATRSPATPPPCIGIKHNGTYRVWPR